MNIGIITVGDELLIGQTIDTNSAWIAKKATETGFDISSMASVKDDEALIIKAINNAFMISDILLVTGGVGPTNDDITKYTLCRYYEEQLVYNHDVMENIVRLFKERGLEINELTKEQASVPTNCEIIQNKVGTAPILWFERNNKVLISLPGIPQEMHWAMKEVIFPRLQSHYKRSIYEQRSLYTYGITESVLASKLIDFENQLPNIFKLAYLPEDGVIRLRLSVRGHENKEQLEQLWAQLKSIIGSNLLVETEDSLEEVLINMLKTKQLSLSLAESCSGGYIAHVLTSVPGTSSFFRGGVVSYSNSAKMNLLHVSQKSLKQHGAVSQQVVEEMARGAMSAFNSQCVIAVSGIAGPAGGTAEKPVGTVWICTIASDKIKSKKYTFGKTREINIRKSGMMGIVQLLSMLLHDN